MIKFVIQFLFGRTMVFGCKITLKRPASRIDFVPLHTTFNDSPEKSGIKFISAAMSLKLRQCRRHHRFHTVISTRLFSGPVTQLS